MHRLAVDRPLEVAEHADAVGSCGPCDRCASANGKRRPPAALRARRSVGIDLGVGHHQPTVVADDHAPVALVEDDRLAVDQADLVVHALRLLAQQVERAVVEHVAVLIDLDERGPPVRRGLPQHLA